MNHIYRVIFNRHTSTFQAVAETAKSQGKTHSQKSSNSSTTVSKLVLRPLSVVIGLLVGSVAVAAPTGGEVVAGAANIHQAGNITNINQSSQNAVINWQQFGIKAHETVNFNQPNVNAVTLNRVIGNEKSVIDGAMNANGKVFIQNANGTLIGKNAQINVGGLVATTAKISDEDFMSGNYRFTGATGSIENLGDIKVPKGGVVALIAPIVKNSGTITAHGSDTLLASAESFSITLPNDGQFSYTLDKGTLQGLVDNGGAILADSGRVVLTAKGIDTVKKSIIKHSGIIEANTIKNNNGVIELLGDLDNSELHLTGTLKAEGKGTDDGGFIETSAAKLNIDDQAHISTQSEQGKTGTWLIDPKDFTVAPKGGDTTGSKVSQGLKKNNVQLKSKSGAKDGKGDVIINDTISWNKNKLTLTADNDIHINKTLNGTGTASLALEYGQNTENGVRETYTNGKTVRYYANYYLDKNTPLKNRTVKINLPEGQNFSIKKGVNGTTEIFDVIHQMPEVYKNRDGIWEDVFDTDRIAFGKDIDVSYTKNEEYDGFLGWRLPNDATLVHGLGHRVNGLSLRPKKLREVNVGLFQSNGSKGEFRDIGVTKFNIQAEAISGKNYFGGLVGNGNNISNSYAVGSINIASPNLYNNDYIGVLAGASKDVLDSYATGNVKVSTSDARVGGLLGYGQGVSNSYATGNVSVSGSYNNVGGLIGYSYGNVSNSYATGNVSVSGQSGYSGGLVGYATYSYNNDISNSYATGNVSTTGNKAYAGGLMGYGDGTPISNNYATGNVSTTGEEAYAGGLMGYGSSHTPISNSYATGNVSTTGEEAYAGGLVGRVYGSWGNKISNSYATGRIETRGDRAHAGGLVGHGENVLDSYATGNVATSGFNASAGGLVGLGSNVTNSYATGKITTSGELAYAGGLIGYGYGALNSYAAGNVMTSGKRADTGGLIGRGGNIVNSYANNTVSAKGSNSYQAGIVGYYDSKNGSQNTFFNKNKNTAKLRPIGGYEANVDRSKIVNLTGKTEAELKRKATFKDWDFEKVWDIKKDGTPTLRNVARTVVKPVKPIDPPKLIDKAQITKANQAINSAKKIRKDMLDKLVASSKTGKLTDVNALNKAIKTSIIKAKAIIDSLPNGEQKNILLKELAKIKLLTKAEIDSAKKTADTVAAEKAKQEAEARKIKNAQNLVDKAQKTRSSVKQRFMNEAKKGHLLDVNKLSSEVNKSIAEANKVVSTLPNGAEKTKLNNQIKQLQSPVFTFAEVILLLRVAQGKTH